MAINKYCFIFKSIKNYLLSIFIFLICHWGWAARLPIAGSGLCHHQNQGLAAALNLLPAPSGRLGTVSTAQCA
jgi:Zn-dependent protease